MSSSCHTQPVTSYPWERLPGEPKRAFTCYAAFRDAGKDRSVTEVYRQTTGKTAAKQASGTWNAWVGRWRWWERVDAFDAYMDRQRVQTQADAHKAALNEFREAHLALARVTFCNAMRVSRELERFLESKPAIANWDDALKASRLINIASASEMWADALGVAMLLDRIEEQGRQ